MPHFYGLPLDLCGKCIAALFAKRATIFANAPHFHGKSAAIHALYKTVHFQGYRESAATQRDKRGARYTALISASAARLLHSFLCIPYINQSKAMQLT